MIVVVVIIIIYSKFFLNLQKNMTKTMKLITKHIIIVVPSGSILISSLKFK